MKKLKVCIGLLAGVAAGLALSFALNADASRNSSGTYSLPAGNPAVPNTIITSSQWNSNFSDLGTEVSASLCRNPGCGGMLTNWRGIDGTVAAPSYSYSSETGTGDYRAGAANECRAVTGTQVQCWTPTGSTIPGTLNVTGLSTFNGSATRGAVNLVPLATPSAPSNGDAWVDTSLNRFSVRVAGATQNMLTSPLFRTDLPAVGQQVSASSGGYSPASDAAYHAATNLSVSLTTSGRPVIVMVQPDTSDGAPGAGGFFTQAGGGNQIAWLRVLRGVTPLSVWHLQYNSTAGATTTGSFMVLDAPGAGTYTYSVQVKVTASDGVSASGGATLSNYILAAYEL